MTPMPHTMTSHPIQRSELPYTPFYCEENIWHLCGMTERVPPDSRVVIISNPARACAVWQQRAARKPAEPIIWDYHVVLLACNLEVLNIWDFDTLLDMPCLASQWLYESFWQLPHEFAHLAPRFRLIASSEYRAKFSSDRTHMWSEDGSWKHPPPTWPAIVIPGAPSFHLWTEMAESDQDCLTLTELRALVS